MRLNRPGGAAPGGATWSGGLSNLPVPAPYLLGIGVAVWLERRRPTTPPGPRYVERLIGWSIAVAGVRLIGRSWMAAMPVRLADPALLVTSGPYAVSRNPMYVGWALLQLGVGLVRGSRWMIAAVPVSVALVHRDVCGEERTLENAFGVEYRRYRATVPRYRSGIRASGRTHARTGCSASDSRVR
jgi:protein-S-isoprenylcysteine O-methyltransferase Ste14